MTAKNGNHANPISHFPHIDNPDRGLGEEERPVGFGVAETLLTASSISEVISIFRFSISAWSLRFF
jgi:hypothetical protein